MTTKDGDTLRVDVPGGGTLTYVADARVPVGTFVEVPQVDSNAWRPVLTTGLMGSPGIIRPYMVAR